jgi:hypothetical protein
MPQSLRRRCRTVIPSFFHAPSYFVRTNNRGKLAAHSSLIWKKLPKIHALYYGKQASDLLLLSSHLTNR